MGGRGLAGVLAIVAALILPGVASAGPNVVLIVTDDQRWDTLSAMPTVRSELTARGVTFSNAFAVNPLCCPSRASILTGDYSHTTRVYENSGLSRFDETRTIALALDRAGWRTGFLGKYLNGYAGTRVPPGWERWFAFSPSNAHRYFDYVANDDGALVAYGTGPADYSTDVLAGEAEAFLAVDDPRPFFLAVFPTAPHSPAEPAPRHAGSFAALPPWRPAGYGEDRSDKPAWVHRVRFDPVAADQLRRRQYQSLLGVDDAVRRIVAALEDAGKLAETMIIFTSDNGFLWGEHGILHKVVPYEESIRVPLVVRYGAQARVEPRLALNIDLAPTVADLAGIPWSSDGESLLPLLAAPGTRGRSEFLVESRGYPGFPSPVYCALRTRDTKLVLYADGSRELYDLEADPHELENLAGRPAWRAREEALRVRLARRCKPPPQGLSRTLLCTRQGSSGRDRMRGTPRYDVLCSRGGDDDLFSGDDTDWVYAGSGNDVVRARDGSRDYADCGPGRDVLFADARDTAIGNSCERVRRPLQRPRAPTASRDTPWDRPAASVRGTAG